MLTPSSLVKGNKYNWKNQPERLVYMGAAKYPGDSRVWFKFALVGKPDVVWCEVLGSELAHLEETKEQE